MADVAIADPSAENKRINPTLYIGVGGTGKEVLLKLRRRILQTLWNGRRLGDLNDFPVASFFYMDVSTIDAKEDERKKDEIVDPLMSLIEFDEADVVQERLNMDKYLSGRNLERFPEVNAWLPSTALIDAGTGAGQIRAVSRLYFFDKANAIYQNISNKTRALQQNVGNARLERLGLDVEREVNIVVIASLAGGTGSGAFLDMGYMCSSLLDPKPKNVILYAVTGGAFAGQNDRVLANSYAALSELEFAMTASEGRDFTPIWPPNIANRALRPYDHIYFVDAKNVAQQATGARGMLFDMIADTLFEELSDEGLRGKRREDLVNQAQYRIEAFQPPLSARIGDARLTFSRAYSSSGQVTLDTRAKVQFEGRKIEAALEMVKGFFRIAEDEKANTPKPDEVRDFLKRQLFLAPPTAFTDFPSFLRDAETLPNIELVGKILSGADRKPLEELQAGLRRDFDRIPAEYADLTDWRGQVEDVRQRFERTLSGDVTSSSDQALIVSAIVEQRRRLFEQFRAPDGLRQALYDRLDNTELGGLTYVIRLIGQVRDEILNESNGYITKLRHAAGEFDSHAEKLKSGFYTKALDNLQKAARKGLIGGPDRGTAEQNMDQLIESLRYALEFNIRAIACREAETLLRDVVQELGQASAVGEGSGGAAGILAEMERGRAAVRETIAVMAQEQKVFRDAAEQDNPIRMAIPGGDLKLDVADTDFAAWGRETLGSSGGSKVLFPQLRDEDARGHVINHLRGVALERLRDQERRIPSVMDSLTAMNETDRRELLQKAMLNALPWINADFDRQTNAFDPKMLTVFVAVDDREAFRRAFDEELRQAIPSRFQGKDIYYVASEVRGRVVIYSEITGVALNALVGLHGDWERAYLARTFGDDTTRLPTHTDRNIYKFPRPTAPTVEEVDDLLDRLELYLRGVAFGRLRRAPDGVYKVNVSPTATEDWLSVGTERRFYRTDFDASQKKALHDQIAKDEGRFGPWQDLLAGALFQYYAERVYAPIKVMRSDGSEARSRGVAHSAARNLSQRFLQRFEKSSEGAAHKDDVNPLVATLLARIHEWSAAIHDSRDDTTATEANLDPNDATEQQAQEKRVVDWSIADAGAIRRWAGLEPSQSQAQSQGSATSGGPPPIPQAAAYHVVENNAAAGPFTIPELQARVGAGAFTKDTLVWKDGAADWMKAGEVAELAFLFRRSAPPPIPPRAQE